MLTRRSLFGALQALALLPFLAKEAKAEDNRRVVFQLYLEPGSAVPIYKAGQLPRSKMVDLVHLTLKGWQNDHPDLTINSNISFTFMTGDWKPVGEPVSMRVEKVPELMSGMWGMVDHALNRALWGTPKIVPHLAERNRIKATIDMVEIAFYAA